VKRAVYSGLVSGLMITLLAGCAQVSVRPVDDITPLTNTYWMLQEVAGQSVPANMQPKPSLLMADDGNVYGNTGCNEIQGRYQVATTQVRFTAMSATRKFCQNNSIEQPFLQALEDAAGVTLDGDTMILREADATALATFKAAKRNR